MQLLRSKVCGYCMGVRRAMDLAVSSLENPPVEGVYSLGPLIHNPQVMEDLAKSGIRCIGEDELESLSPGSIIIIRAHGVSPQIESTLTRLGLQIIDATCPRVKASQKIAARAYREGRLVILAGDRGHGEVIGLQGHAPSCAVFGKDIEARNWLEEKGLLNHSIDIASRMEFARPLLIPQTTFSKGELAAIAEALRKVFTDLEVANTICKATEDRQRALDELLSKVDVLVVCGGRNSANTKRLKAIADERGVPAVLVETPQELPDWVFSQKRVGLTAGASTPDSMIDAVEKRLIAKAR